MPIAERVHREPHDHHAQPGRGRGLLAQGLFGPCVVFAALPSGCGSNDGNARPGEVGIYDPDGGPLFGSTPADEAGGASLAVSITPPGAAICPGQCVDLTARAAGGTAPYAYRWNPGTSASAASLHVCPSTTTTFMVTATDSAGGSGELGSAPVRGSASVTVMVSASLDCGADAQAVGDATVDVPVDSAVAVPVESSTGAWSGCESVSATTPMMDASLCVPDAGSGTFFIPDRIVLPKPLLAGQSYSVTLDIGLVVPTLSALDVSVWGTTGECAYGQKLTTQPLAVTPLVTTTSRVTFCATADANYSGLTVGVYPPSPPMSGGFSEQPPIGQVCPIASCAPSDL